MRLPAPFRTSAVVLLASCILRAAAADAQTLWADGTGSWFTSGNWSAGVPNAAVDARVNNGGTVQIFQGGAAANSVTLGREVGTSGTLRTDRSPGVSPGSAPARRSSSG